MPAKPPQSKTVRKSWQKVRGPQTDDDDDHDAAFEGFSTSVNRAVKRFEPTAHISSWAITKEICKLHPEYGGKIAGTLRESSGPEHVSGKPVTAWLEDVGKVVVPGRDGIIHGRRVIVGLAKIDTALRDYLMPSGLVSAIEEELGGSQAIYASEPGSRTPSDPTPLHIDNPASADQLGRNAFARALALRLDRIWTDNNEVRSDSSFVLHLHGPWGSGKSSLLNLLRQHLQPSTSTGQASRWLVVDFNAWQHQRLSPPWWPLLDNIYRQSHRQLGERHGKDARWWKIWLREYWWRFTTGNREHLVLGTSVLALTFLTWFLAWRYWAQIAGALDVVGKAVSAIIAILGLIVGVGAFATRPFISGSAGAAERFVRSAVDPMTRVAKHFKDLIGWIDRPIIIFIDDLDRCRSEYVVSLLEGVQTLFKDSKVMYVIAADRRWLYACYSNVYETFAAALQEPGRDLGALFLEKAVQLSVSLPRLSESLQAAFWNYLIHGQPQDVGERMDKAAVAARQEFEGAVTPEEIAERLKQPSGPSDPIQEHARREEAVMRLATEKAEASTEYFLKDFAPLLEPNPRAMKRLLNAYALHRDMAILSGLDVLGNLTKRRQLVLWTIVCLRWPLLEQILIENMGYIDVIHGSKPITIVPEAMRPLFERDSIKSVFRGDGIVGVKLDRKAVQDFAELRASNSSSAAVG